VFKAADIQAARAASTELLRSIERSVSCVWCPVEHERPLRIRLRLYETQSFLQRHNRRLRYTFYLTEHFLYLSPITQSIEQSQNHLLAHEMKLITITTVISH